MIFASSTYWNLPSTEPANANTPAWLGWLKSKSAYPYPRLSLSTMWSVPVYYPKDGDPEYVVAPSLYGETVTMRIPRMSSTSGGSDAALVTIDYGRDETISLWKAEPSPNGVFWSAAGTARYLLSSDGLCKTPPNFGHRGIPPAMMAIRADEMAAGLISRRMEVFVPGTANVAVYPPMCAAEPGKGGIIPEGAVLRVKPSVDLTKLRLKPKALVIARALQTYGAVVGDNDMNVTTIKCDRALVGGGLLASDLSKLTWNMLEFAA